MIADSDTNVIFVADTLGRGFPAVYQRLASILREHDVPLRTIPGTLAVWCRDYLPVQVAGDRFVQFRYEPDYLTGKYRHLRADGEIGPKLPWLTGCLRSGVVLDGGNVVGWGDRAIVTDKVFSENPGRSREVVVEGLKDDLGLAELIVVPGEPDDPIGHSDGMVCWLSERSVLINDYSRVSESFRRRIHESFRRHQVDLVEFPYEPQDGGRDGIPTAAGNWTNFVRATGVLVVQPSGWRGTGGLWTSWAACTPIARSSPSIVGLWRLRAVARIARPGRQSLQIERFDRVKSKGFGTREVHPRPENPEVYLQIALATIGRPAACIASASRRRSASLSQNGRS